MLLLGVLLQITLGLVVAEPTGEELLALVALLGTAAFVVGTAKGLLERV